MTKGVPRRGNAALCFLVIALIEQGVTYFEDIFAEVAQICGDDRLEQKISALLEAYQGKLWQAHTREGHGPFYSTLK